MSAESPQPYVVEVNPLRDTLPELRVNRDFAIEKAVFLSDSLLTIENNRSQRTNPAGGGLYEGIITDIQKQAEEIDVFNQAIDDYEIASGLTYDHGEYPEDRKVGDHATGTIEGNIDGKKVILRGQYWCGNNLDGWIDDCEGEVDGEKLTQDQALSIWDRYEWILRYEEEYKNDELRDREVPSFEPVISSVSRTNKEEESKKILEDFLEKNNSGDDKKEELKPFCDYFERVSEIPILLGVIVRSTIVRAHYELIYVSENLIPNSEPTRDFLELESLATGQLGKDLYPEEEYGHAYSLYATLPDFDGYVERHLAIEREVDKEREAFRNGETKRLEPDVPRIMFAVKFID